MTASIPDCTSSVMWLSLLFRSEYHKQSFLVICKLFFTVPACSDTVGRSGELKGQFMLKSKIHIFPFTCSAIYQSRLFWCELPSFGFGFLPSL